MAIQYAGGTTVDALYTADGTQQGLTSALEDAMNTAGWTTLSGHHSATIVLQSATTPNGNSICARLKTTANACATVEILTAAASLVSTACYLLPTNGVSFRFLACRYQVFVFVPGSVTIRYSLQFGVLYVPPFLSSAIVGELGWIKADSSTDAGAAAASFRTTLTTSGAYAKSSTILNGAVMSISGNTPSANPCLYFPQTTVANGGAVLRMWHDGSYMMMEPYLATGIFNNTDALLVRGQLWNSIIVCQGQVADGTYSFDGHTWRIYTLVDTIGSLLILSA